MEYRDGLKYIYFYTNGKKGGSKEIKALLSYLRHSIIENVKDEATQSIHDAVEKIKHSAEVRGKVGYHGQFNGFIEIKENLQKVPSEGNPAGGD